ncbi:unnamed protein product (macronuclear) [Paramecium tetraurelia]|uniref:t-SNARE coiled-coil homology domain-containing protein n=1 Tax=Paramecium tetraurelia TaxID=5888 RepID=A0BPG4_PARTE|nr:uncharacterized protein GSPATT00005180001 [Paramecium tetraurelia]CAK60431.1 unnamed protein product [Paramecium tetraurelia]|eukprot:XP_001427829.1 hypothetical protein (macronuclear) [Paramecium tetraurelia strain d4-2]
MGQQCCRNSPLPDLEDKQNNNPPEQYSNKQDTFATRTQSYQTRINELENNVQTSLEVMNKLNDTILNLVVQVESLNNQLEQKQKLEQIEPKVVK